MRVPALCVAVLMGCVAAGAAETPPEKPAAPPESPSTPPEQPQPPQRVLRLELETLRMPGYKAARELRLALSDSPMVRLELAALREQLAFMNPGPSGIVVNYGRPVPLTHLEFTSEAQDSLVEQWKRWGELSAEDKLVAGIETGLVLWTLVELAKRAH